LYTSALNGKAASLKKTAWTYGILTAFAGVFSFVYLLLSHGESSPFMVWLFVPPLLLGFVPALLFMWMRASLQPGRSVRRIWNSAVAALTCGMLVRAIINISGRYTEYDTIYWIMSGLLFLAAAAFYVRHTMPMRRRTMTKQQRVINPEMQV
jgi:Na+-transporting NADH:ubiquinone oxidoreductase subunit NqrB